MLGFFVFWIACGSTVQPCSAVKYHSDEFGSKFRLNSDLCRAKYSCASNATQLEGGSRQCSCQDFCGVFQSCCHDKALEMKGTPLPEHFYSCTSKFFSKACEAPTGIFVVNKCPPERAGSNVSALCEYAIDNVKGKPDSISTPVTDTLTGITYRNVYCSSCWSIPRDRAIRWAWLFSCLREPQLSLPGEVGGSEEPDLYSLEFKRKIMTYMSDACSVTYQPPAITRAVLHNCSVGLVQDCPSGTKAAVQKACREGPMQLTHTQSTVYRNSYCANCSTDPFTGNPTCESPGPRKAVICMARMSASFSMLLSPEYEGCSMIKTASGSAAAFSKVCGDVVACLSERAKTGTLSPQCSFLCPVGEFSLDAGCHVRNTTRVCNFNIGYKDIPKTLSSTIVNSTLVVPLNDTAAACIACDIRTYDSFEVENGTLYVNDTEYPTYGSLLFHVDDAVATACALKEVAREGQIDVGECQQLPDTVSTALLLISEVSLVLFLVAYSIVTDLRRFPGDMTANKSCALFLGYLLFLLRPVAEPSPLLCTTFAVGIHFFLISAFTWMALYALEVLRALSFQYGDPNRNRRRIAYYAVGWSLPLAIVTAALVADHLGAAFRPAYGLPQCFIGSRLGNRVFFMAPLCCFVLVSLVSFTYMIVKLGIVARQTRAVRQRHREKLAISVKLFFSLGLLWAFAVLASFVDRPWLMCAFTVLNSSQGLYLLFAFTCNKEMLRRCRELAGNIALSMRTASTSEDAA